MNAEQVKKHFEAIFKAHPDARKIAESDDFLGWVDRQPPMIQKAVESGTAEDIIEILHRYKLAVGITRKKPRFTVRQIEAMPLAEFTRREKEIDEAMQAGMIT